MLGRAAFPASIVRAAPVHEPVRVEAVAARATRSSSSSGWTSTGLRVGSATVGCSGAARSSVRQTAAASRLRTQVSVIWALSVVVSIVPG
jgi:hypothetical protein